MESWNQETMVWTIFLNIIFFTTPLLGGIKPPPLFGLSLGTQLARTAPSIGFSATGSVAALARTICLPGFRPMSQVIYGWFYAFLGVVNLWGFYIYGKAGICSPMTYNYTWGQKLHMRSILELFVYVMDSNCRFSWICIFRGQWRTQKLRLRG